MTEFGKRGREQRTNPNKTRETSAGFLPYSVKTSEYILAASGSSPYAEDISLASFKRIRLWKLNFINNLK